MDNEFSQAMLVAPVIPSDFEALAGNTKTSFAQALINLLNGSIVTGINPDQPSNFDLGQMQNQITTLQSQVAALQLTQQIVTLTNQAAGLITVAFPSPMPSTSYSVGVAPITTNTSLGGFTWGLIVGSQTTTQCQIRVDGSTGPYDIAVVITQLGG